MSAQPHEPWTAADARRDACDQVEEANAAARDEISAARNEDWVHIFDERAPTRAEADADAEADWLWARERGMA